MADNMAEMGNRMGEQAMDEGKSTMDQMTDTAKQYAGKAKEYAQQGYDAAAEKSKQLKDSTQHYIEENPWYAIGIALGVGVLLGLVLRGSSRD